MYACIFVIPRPEAMRAACGCEKRSTNDIKYHDFITQSYGPPPSPMWCIYFCNLHNVLKNYQSQQYFCDPWGSSVLFLYLLSSSGYRRAGSGRHVVSLQFMCHANMQSCTHAHMHLCTHTHMQTCLHTCIHFQVCMRTCVHQYMKSCLHTCMMREI